MKKKWRLGQVAWARHERYHHESLSTTTTKTQTDPRRRRKEEEEEQEQEQEQEEEEEEEEKEETVEKLPFVELPEDDKISIIKQMKTPKPCITLG